MKSVPLFGWGGLKNGALLAQAEKAFDVLLTMDSNMIYQLDLSKYRIAVIALKARSNRLADTPPLMPAVLTRLASAPKGTLTVVSSVILGLHSRASRRRSSSGPSKGMDEG